MKTVLLHASCPPRRALMALLTSLLVLGGCQAEDARSKQVEGIPSKLQDQLAFTCAQEKDRIPPRDPEADQLYAHARWLVKANILKQDPEAYPPIERLLRIATAYGHDKANIELRQLVQTGKTGSENPASEVIDLTEELIARGIPSGYYAMGWYLERGYGVKQDTELALQYYRKSADLGSPEGQYLVGDKLSDERTHGTAIAEIGWAMYRCSADQKQAKAAYELGVHQQGGGHFADAMKYYQIAAAEGLAVAPASLSAGFSAQWHAHSIRSLGQAADAERERRYEVIEKFLSDYDYLNAKVPEIDQIVPLPPAKLPPWNGKFQWLEAHQANVPPPLPSEERIAGLAKAKGLDPKTGRTLQITK